MPFQVGPCRSFISR